MLADSGIKAKFVVVTDNNDIDREVTYFRPTHVVIEALWVIPSKFEVLIPLHKNVTWIVRLHSDLPFLANESTAMSWVLDYLKHNNVVLSANSPRIIREIMFLAKVVYRIDLDDRVVFLPNCYPVPHHVTSNEYDEDKSTIDVGCFGAIRPLKNHLVQAVAAIEFAECLGKKLHFHINSERVEMKGEAVVENLRSLFHHVGKRGHHLVTHGWMHHHNFIKVVQRMDLGMQVSFSETFNIVAADFVVNGVPVVVSREVPWAHDTVANPASTVEVLLGIERAWKGRHRAVAEDVRRLRMYDGLARDMWLDYLLGE